MIILRANIETLLAEQVHDFVIPAILRIGGILYAFIDKTGKIFYNLIIKWFIIQ